MKTSIITKKEVENVLTPSVANEMVEKAFRAYGLSQVDMPAKSYPEDHPFPGLKPKQILKGQEVEGIKRRIRHGWDL